METVKSVLTAYSIEEGAEIQPISLGLIHKTYRIVSQKGDFILQQLHPSISSPEIGSDMIAVTEHLAAKGIRSPKIVKTNRGEAQPVIEGHAWRLQTTLPGKCHEKITNIAMVRSAGECLGAFHAAMSDIQHEFQSPLHLHNTRDVLIKLENATKKHAKSHLVQELGKEIAYIQSVLPNFLLPLDIPIHAIHGDPKISNFLFEGMKATSLIDLDTCQIHTPLVDIGDAFRSWCGGLEDDPANTFSKELFDAGREGYLHASRAFLSAEEVALIPQAIGMITLELAARFATDYLEDSYFGWDAKRYESRRAHNAARTRGQIALFKSLEKQILV